MESIKNMLSFRIYLACIMLATYTVDAFTDLPCQPRPIVLKTRDFHQSGSDFKPEFFEIYRCSGADAHYPSTDRCVPKSQAKIKIPLVLRFSGFSPDDDSITVDNHTSCAMKCVCEMNGEKCENGVTKVSCQHGLSWDTKSCGCIIPCGITGETKNPNDDGEKTVTMTIFIVVLIAEFILVALITFLILDACKYQKHSKGVIFRATQYVRSLSVSDASKVPTLKRNRPDTGSVSFLYEIDQDNNSNYKSKDMPTHV